MLVKNTFIDVPPPDATMAIGTRQRARSVPKDFGSKKNEWEAACHMLGYQHDPVKSQCTHTVVLEKCGCELGLDVSRSGNTLLVEGVGPGAVQWWNAQHVERQVMPGDNILEVNGVSGDTALLLQAIRASNTLTLTVQSSALRRRKRSDPNVASTFTQVPGHLSWPMRSERGVLQCWCDVDSSETPCLDVKVASQFAMPANEHTLQSLPLTLDSCH